MCTCGRSSRSARSSGTRSTSTRRRCRGAARRRRAARRTARASAAVTFGDVMFTWYMRQGDAPLAPSRGQLYDHVALSVADLDAWIAKLRSEGVKLLQEPYRLGDTRAGMIARPSPH